MNLKTDFLSKILYAVIIAGLIGLTGLILGLPWLIPLILKDSIFYLTVNHNSILILLYVTGIPAWIILWLTRRLTKNIIKREPFSESSIFSLKGISICAIIIFICYFLASIFLSATLGIIVVAIAAFMVSLISAILYRLVQVALEIQKENELTI
ncbi:DUF2975 domain-containing protein [uncultured Clostridium sp.]|uniref:DUF2975 domain-containing protein n=1 Tax=uncultured Clostridium sp. TaxID=59620 RepID=UPI0028F01BFE|nr:DUF2975 domain-containing protein [uncultured Clostridium sp.]